MNRDRIAEMEQPANGTPEPGPYAPGGEFGAPEMPSSLAAAIVEQNDRLDESPTQEPETPAEQRHGAANRLDAVDEQLSALAARVQTLEQALDAVGERLASIARAQTAQGLIGNALMDSEDEVRKVLRMDPVAWKAIVERAGEGQG